jgi:TolB-like protein/tetratricopeptide (TPR) repeat protein
MSGEANRPSDPAPVDRLSQIWRRINQYKVVQWSVAYLALAYAIQHAIILTGESFEWPNAVPRFSMLLFVLGLPLVMTFAWYHGERASRRFSAGECTIISLLLLCASLLFYVFVKPESAATPPRVAQEASVTAARAAAASPKGAISVAVLPFLNLSSDKEQEFFSDGMTEEITTALAKVPDLRVVARTSAFEFKGKNVDIRTMGEELGATHLIEGSIRKAGNRLRITAQLIKADDGTHVWAEDYDREMTDVFAIQEDIARAITASLHMTLGLKPDENLVNNRSIDPESYEQYLRARGVLVSRSRFGDGKQMLNTAAILENVVRKSDTSEAPLEKLRITVNQLRDKAEAAARRASELDPDYPSGLSSLEWSRTHLLQANALAQKFAAVRMDGTSENLFVYAFQLGAVGRINEAVKLSETAHSEDPLDPPIINGLARFRWLSGDNEGALAMAQNLRPAARGPLVAMILASEGRFREAADTLVESDNDPASPAAKAAELLRKAPAHIAPDQLPSLPADLQFVYLYVGAPERVMTAAQRQVDVGFLSNGIGGLDRLWHPAYAPVRKTERFRQLVRKAGLVEYWRAKGWPPQCHPTTGDDFECS